MGDFPNNREQLIEFFTEMKTTQSEGNINERCKPFYESIKKKKYK